MAPTNPRPQRFFFYTESWTFAIDCMFIDVLVEEAELHNTILSSSSSDSIRLAQRKVNAVFNTNFTYRQCFFRFRKLQQRYHVFDFIICLSAVYYDRSENVVHTFDKYVWDYAVLKFKLAEAYMIQGEPAFEQLRKIFGEPDPPSLAATEVIELSSDDDHHDDDDHHHNENHVLIPVDDDQHHNDNNVPNPDDVVLYPRETFQVNVQDHSNTFWDDLALCTTESWSPGSNNDFGAHFSNEGSGSSPAKLSLQPKCLWPKPVVMPPINEENCVVGKDLGVHLHMDNDTTSSQGSSASVNGPYRGKGKWKVADSRYPKGMRGSRV